ncbi:MAG: beta-lactamase family protein [Acidimicrobiia bacterium]|nr:beta-lactamase family protein [Acidimicrobiia bacterium]
MTRHRFVAFCSIVALLGVSACGDDTAETGGTTESTTSAAPAVTTTRAAAPSIAPTTTFAAPETREYDFSAVSPVVQDFIDERGLNGAGLIVVHRDDGVIHHEHWGEFDEDRISLIASSSKMISAGVLARLDDEGVLDLDAPVADVVDWGAGNPGITPAQLVSNSSGLVGLGPDVLFAPYLCQFGPTFTLQDCGEAIFTTAGDDADVVPADSEFRYGGAQWQVAGAVAEAASGKSWAQLIDEIYVQPCELDSLAFNNPFLPLGSDGSGYPSAFNADPATLAPTDNPNIEGGAYVTTGDYGKLLLMHLREGMCGQNRVLSAGALARMHDDRIAEAYDGDAGGPDSGYGMGWWVDRLTGRISDGGAFGSVPWLDLEQGYGAYLVIEADSDTGGQLASQLFDVIDTAVTSLT